MKKAVYSEAMLQSLFGDLRALFRKSGYLRISASAEKPRSLPQNRLSHDWYTQVAAELGDQSALDVKCECKLICGVPIMRAESEEFREVYDAAIKNTMTYDQKLKVMRFFPVTSLMSTDQLSRYLEAVKAHYAGRVHLEFPDEGEV